MSALQWYGVSPTSRATRYLAHARRILAQANDQDAIGLANTSLRPQGERAIALVQGHFELVLLLGQPRYQFVLVIRTHYRGAEILTYYVGSQS